MDPGDASSRWRRLQTRIRPRAMTMRQAVCRARQNRWRMMGGWNSTRIEVGGRWSICCWPWARKRVACPGWRRRSLAGCQACRSPSSRTREARRGEAGPRAGFLESREMDTVAAPEACTGRRGKESGRWWRRACLWLRCVAARSRSC